MKVSHTKDAYGIAGTDFVVMEKAGVPNSNDGAGVAGKGSYCSDTTNGDAYINTGTKAVPAWAKVTIGTALSSEKAITDFSFAALEPAVTGTVNATAHTVALEVPNGTNVTALVATFTLSASASAKVGTTAQVSATTANNFTNPVTYIVTAADTTTQKWVVTVTIAEA